MSIDSHNKQCSSIEGNARFYRRYINTDGGVYITYHKFSFPDSLAAKDDRLTQFKLIKKRLRDNMVSSSV